MHDTPRLEAFVYKADGVIEVKFYVAFSFCHNQGNLHSVKISEGSSVRRFVDRSVLDLAEELHTSP